MDGHGQSDERTMVDGHGQSDEWTMVDGGRWTVTVMVKNERFTEGTY